MKALDAADWMAVSVAQATLGAWGEALHLIMQGTLAYPDVPEVRDLFERIIVGAAREAGRLYDRREVPRSLAQALYQAIQVSHARFPEESGLTYLAGVAAHVCLKDEEAALACARLAQRCLPKGDASFLVLVMILLDHAIVDRPLIREAARYALVLWRRNPQDIGAVYSVLFELYTRGRLVEASRLARRLLARFDQATVADAPSLKFWDLFEVRDSFFRAQVLTQPRPLADVRLEKATHAPGPAVLLVSCDGGYWRLFTKWGAPHILARAPGLAVHVHLVDPEPADLADLEALRAREPRFGFSVNQRATDPIWPADDPAAYRKTYYACARFLALPRLIAAYDKPILLLDADGILRADPEPIVADWQARDVGFAVRHGKAIGPFREFTCSTLYLNDRASARFYAEVVAGYIAAFMANGKPYWTLDQVALYCAYHWMKGQGVAPRLELLDGCGVDEWFLSPDGSAEEKSAKIKAMIAAEGLDGVGGQP
ncbi:hypothetical protein ROR02_08430 [Pararhodospirillum oryzae]|uniref:Uncharacterized protein n=2 Tax=Pararhodospirillum oryzae TaxID=478448 RepID=A0A512H5G5_9PROT|nr:hypothetical protein ROR02_08430 [Pararhodospirillum oryzae]